MEVTAKEAKHIERLRKQLRRWPRTRWGALLVGIMTAASSAVHVWGAFFFSRIDPGLVDVSLRLANDADTPEAKVTALEGAISAIRIEQFNMAEEAFAVVMAILLAFASLCCFIIVFRDWNGNAKKTLLLKLYDDAIRQQPDAAKSEGGAGAKTGT